MKARIIWTDFMASFRGFYRNKGTLFFSIAFPVILILLFGAIFSGGGTGTYTVHIKNFDYENGEKVAQMVGNSTDLQQFLGNHTNFYDALYAHLNQTGVIEVDIVTDQEAATEQDLYRYVDRNTLKSVMVIPENYSAGLAVALAQQDARLAPNITLLLDQSEMQRNNIIMSVMEQLASRYNLMLAGGSQFVQFDPSEIIQEDFGFIDFFLPGVIALTVMTNSVFGIVETNLRLRKRGILRKLVTTPFTRSEWLMAKMLYMLFTSFLSTSVVLAVGILVWDISFRFNAYLFILVVAASFAFAGIGMLLTRFVTDEETAPAAANAVTFPQMFLSGIFFQLETMPGFLQVIAKFMPLYYVGEGLRDAMIYGNMEGALFNTMVVVIFAVIVFAAGVAITSWKEK
ncbi:MAG: ABC transporter permease, partial [Thermoplasmatota archaeon]